MSAPGVAGPSQPVILSGTDVGQLDPTQGSRLLSTPGARLSFASYDPYTASVEGRKLSTQDRLSAAKRIVVELLPNGSSTWRWVPRAKGVENIADEGQWPRIIDVCGQQVFCSQDQWDIYKLDTEYECTVLPTPLLSTIRRRERDKTRRNDAYAKRHVNELASDDDEDDTAAHKRTRTAHAEPEEEDHLDSDDEVEDLIDDEDDEHGAQERARRLRERREKLAKNRQQRRERTRTKVESRRESIIEDVSMVDLTLDDSPPPRATGPPTENRATSADASSSFMPGAWGEQTWADASSSQTSGGTGTRSHTSSQTSWEDPGPTSDAKSDPQASYRAGNNAGASSAKRVKRSFVESPTGPPLKRVRVVGPGAGKRSAGRYRTEKRSMARDAASSTRTAEASAFDGWNFMANIRFVIPEETPLSNGTTPSTKSPFPEDDPVSLEEKIQRMQEINAYEEAHMRALRAEEEKRKAEAAEAARRRKMEEEMRLRREMEERQRREREQEQERRRREQQEKAERLKRQRAEEERIRQQHARLAQGPWTTQRALEHYKRLAEAFDKAQFSADSPISFVTIPWPVLHRPTKFGVEDIDWQAVEKFFESVRFHMHGPDYKAFVEKSHRRFHPDRWRARRVLQSVEDEELRSGLEVAANTVAQALTPIWIEAKNI